MQQVRVETQPCRPLGFKSAKGNTIVGVVADSSGIGLGGSL